jgi:hypothetical protein
MLTTLLRALEVIYGDFGDVEVLTDDDKPITAVDYDPGMQGQDAAVILDVGYTADE